MELKEVEWKVGIQDLKDKKMRTPTINQDFKGLEQGKDVGASVIVRL